VGKPHLDAILLSPEDAAKVGIKDTSGPLVAKYLKDYNKPDANAKQPTSTPAESGQIPD